MLGKWALSQAGLVRATSLGLLSTQTTQQQKRFQSREPLLTNNTVGTTPTIPLTQPRHKQRYYYYYYKMSEPDEIELSDDYQEFIRRIQEIDAAHAAADSANGARGEAARLAEQQAVREAEIRLAASHRLGTAAGAVPYY